MNCRVPCNMANSLNSRGTDPLCFQEGPYNIQLITYRVSGQEHLKSDLPGVTSPRSQLFSAVDCSTCGVRMCMPDHWNAEQNL